MRESDFIAQNKDKWQEFERILDQSHRDPDKLSELFVQVTDDLSYSRTFYPNRSVRVYLNDLAQRVFLRLYRNRPSPSGRFLAFWTDELPRLVFESRGAFRLSFLVFVLAFLIGMLSSAMDPEFARVILGDRYVEMTLTNIESGDPMAVYKQRGRFGMAFGITLNNLYVAFLTFVMGVVFAIGSLAILLRNGIMVGAFQHFFIERGLFWDSFLTIWTHGALEISAIIIAGAAGITMGRGLLYPGDQSRLRAFQRSARRGVKIMIGVSPVILLAGIIEGYLTRQTETPDAIRLLFILTCLAFILLYFVWYPRLRDRLVRNEAAEERPAAPAAPAPLDLDRIQTPGELFAGVFLFVRRHAGKVLGLALLCGALFTAAAALLSPAPLSAAFSFPDTTFGTLTTIDQFFVNPALPWLPLVNIALITLLTVAINRWVIRERRGPDPPRSPWWVDGIKCLGGVTAMQAVLLTDQWYTLLLALLVFPLPMLWNMVVLAEGTTPWKGLRRCLALIHGQYGRALSLFLTLSILGLLVFSVIDTVMLWFFLDLIGWVVQLDAARMETLSLVLLVGISSFLLHLTAAMLLAGIALLYYTLLEILEANDLRARISTIGQYRRIQGLERES